MGIKETLEKYKWMVPLIKNADRSVKRKIFKAFRKKNDWFYPKGEYNADVKNLIKCMLCPNMCRFDCGTLQAAAKETIAPAYKSRVGYYLSLGVIDPEDEANKEFVDLMYKCTNEENCKVWCPFEFSVVSLLETVREDLNEKGLMPEYCKKQIEKLNNTGTIEDHNIFKTYEEKGIENIETEGKDDIFYYIGCEMMKFPEVVKTNIKILKQAGKTFSTNLEKKVCCGAPALNIRDKDTIKNLAQKNKDLIKETGADLVVSDCPGCVNALTERYRKEEIEIETKIIHIVEYISQLLEEGKLKFDKEMPEEYSKVTIHDPCLLARNLKDTTSIRRILEKLPGVEIIEPIFNKHETHCCGWSGTVHWADNDISIKEAANRIEELRETGVNIIVTACPTCELGLGYGVRELEEEENIKIMDIAELISKLF
jgi:Fe-S oxidoreductase